jgi:hypothetical protein
VKASRSGDLKSPFVLVGDYKSPLLEKESHRDGEGVGLAIGKANVEVGDAPDAAGLPDGEADGVGLGVGVGVGLGNGGTMFSQ